MTFAWPWLALLFPMLFIALRLQKQTRDQGAIEHPYLISLSQSVRSSDRVTNKALLFQSLVWFCLVLALMRPQFIGEPLSQPERGRSLFLAVDISESMLERDMRWNGQTIERFQAVQAVIGEFAENRQGDLLGLVVFGAFADIQAPLTPDVVAVKELLNDLRPGMAEGSTAIGDGLALAAKQLRDAEAQDKVIVLLSDGENNSGSVSPEQALQVAQQSDITVYTIGFGRPRFGFRGVDERTLKRIAEQTNGQYFSATSSEELMQVFDAIEALEPSEEFSRQQRVITEIYWWPLMLAGALLVLMASLQTLPKRRVAK
jgi:Ca-activated chloride channel family protein